MICWTCKNEHDGLSRFHSFCSKACLGTAWNMKEPLDEEEGEEEKKRKGKERESASAEISFLKDHHEILGGTLENNFKDGYVCFMCGEDAHIDFDVVCPNSGKSVTEDEAWGNLIAGIGKQAVEDATSRKVDKKIKDEATDWLIYNFPVLLSCVRGMDQKEMAAFSKEMRAWLFAGAPKIDKDKDVEIWEKSRKTWENRWKFFK